MLETGDVNTQAQVLQCLTPAPPWRIKYQHHTVAGQALCQPAPAHFSGSTTDTGLLFAGHCLQSKPSSFKPPRVCCADSLHKCPPPRPCHGSSHSATQGSTQVSPDRGSPLPTLCKVAHSLAHSTYNHLDNTFFIALVTMQNY